MTSRLTVSAFSVSLDGYGAGPGQDLDNPIGAGGMAVHEWMLNTAAFRARHGELSGGTTGVDNDFVARGFDEVGAWIIGRNMFGPVRGAWPDDSWRGWWGVDPPYHTPVFVLTRHPRPSLEMAGGTTFHFVTDGLRAALDRARAAAGKAKIRLGGGVATLRQAFAERLIDEAHIAIAHVLLGRGEALFPGVDLPALGYHVAETASGEGASHIILRRRDA